MRALTLTGVITPDHMLMVQVPQDIPTGTHEVIVILNAPSQPPKPATLEWSLPVHNVGPWPEGFTVRREDIYGDDGR